MLSDTFSRQGLTPNTLKSTVVLHIGQPVKIVVAEPDRVIVAEHAIVVKSLYPDAEIIICADNDESEVGQKAARSAALAIGGKFILPPIVGQDFNDMLTME